MIMRRSSSAPRILSTYSTVVPVLPGQTAGWELGDSFRSIRHRTFLYGATAWQYRFFTPHDVYGLTQLSGGREAFIADLDSLFMVTSEVVGDLVDVTVGWSICAWQRA